MIWLCCIVVVFFSGCQQSSHEHQYTQIVSSVHQDAVLQATVEKSPKMTDDPHAGLDMSAMAGIVTAATSQNMLAWDVPNGWKENPGAHMRMASFYLAVDPQVIDCSIIALRGPAGALEDNLARWTRQIGLQASAENLQRLTGSAQNLKTKDGRGIKFFDFSRLQIKSKATDDSMMVAMMPLDDTTVFIKMTGTIASVQHNKDSFLKLIGSVSRK